MLWTTTAIDLSGIALYSSHNDYDAQLVPYSKVALQQRNSIHPKTRPRLITMTIIQQHCEM